MPGLDGVAVDQVPLPVTNQTAKEDPQGLGGGGVWVVSVIFKNVELVISIPQIHFPVERQEGESLEKRKTVLNTHTSCKNFCLTSNMTFCLSAEHFREKLVPMNLKV